MCVVIVCNSTHLSIQNFKFMLVHLVIEVFFLLAMVHIPHLLTHTCIFQSFFSRIIINETVSNACQKRMTDPAHHKGSWTKPSLQEFKAFLALSFLTGVIRKPNLKMYWSSSELNATPIFTRLMPCDRYVQIMRYSNTLYYLQIWHICRQKFNHFLSFNNRLSINFSK